MSGARISFVHYQCGHSTPVAGATTTTVCRDCAACEAGHRAGSLARLHLTSRVILGHAHPGPYCDCDMCQSRIP